MLAQSRDLKAKPREDPSAVAGLCLSKAACYAVAILGYFSWALASEALAGSIL
jgi:hypothetical protein